MMETTHSTRFRRRLLGAALTMCALFAAPGQAASDFPNRPVSVLVPFSPGGGTDISARLLATKLSQTTGQSFIVENRPGAAGQIAADAVARARPDGYTLLFANSGMLAINPWLYKLTSDPEKAFAPVSMFSDLPFVLVVSPNVKARTVAELIAQAKAEPSTLTFASSGSGGAPHLAGEIFQEAAGVQLMHVPYKGGGPAMTDLMAGHVDMLFASVLETGSHVKSGKLRALAVTGAQRSPTLPDVPTLDELGLKNAQTQSWTAVLAPAGNSKEVVEKLAAWVREAADAPDVRETLQAQGAVAHGSTPQDLSRIAGEDRARYGDIIKARNLKVE